MVVVVCRDHQVSQEREVKRETLAVQASLCQVPQDVQAPPEILVHQGPLDLQALAQDKTVSRENPGVLVHREREASPDSQARKVIRVTPV